MNRSSSSGVGSNASSGGMTSEVRCFCGQIAEVKKAWTNDNPGRKFYSCVYPKGRSCNFFKWYDIEKPHGWQKAALLEARDLIREQADELKNLRTMVRHEGHAANPEARAINSEVLLQMETMETENKKLKRDLSLSCEREKMGRQFVIISWLGFVCVTAVIVKALN